LRVRVSPPLQTDPPHGAPNDPYRLFFPLGVGLGLAGVSIWPLFHWGFLDGYSVPAHAFVQTNGFVYAFIVGFLWTAVPRFTGTEAPGRPAQLAMSVLLIAEAAAFELYYFSAAHVLFAIGHIGLCVVLVRRFLRRLHPPPETFVLVGFGVLAGLLAGGINLAVAFGFAPAGFELLGKRLLTEGMILLIVLGVGGFLGPRLLGFAQLPNLQNLQKIPQGALRSSVNWKFRFSVLCGLALFASLIVQYGWNPAPAWIGAVMGILRAATVTVATLVNVQPWRLPAVRTTLSWSVWIAHWLLIVALWLVALFSNYATAYLHVLFMGAFSPLILAVGTRVVLSHGGHSLGEEHRSWPLRIGMAATLIGMSARVFAVFASTPESYMSHLAWAGVLWIGGMLVWVSYVFRRLRPER
jgi:uncharacterized protein involved in response to NO